jgi:hypothetical protein
LNADTSGRGEKRNRALGDKGAVEERNARSRPARLTLRGYKSV